MPLWGRPTFALPAPPGFDLDNVGGGSPKVGADRCRGQQPTAEKLRQYSSRDRTLSMEHDFVLTDLQIGSRHLSHRDEDIKEPPSSRDC
jgi:hypothetical protein